MRKMNNKGVSMVEVLIALAIFTILMMPIVHGIITSMKKTSDAKTLQYRNEYVENVVEYIKQDSVENILSGDYFASVGSYSDSTEPVVGSVAFYTDPSDASIDPSTEELKKLADDKGWTIKSQPTGLSIFDRKELKNIYYPYEVYTLGGKVKLGTEHETYSYKVEISNKYYAEKELDAAKNKKVYINPNNLALGVVEDIDHTKVALINGQIANYDTTVSNAFLTKKIEILKNNDPERYEQYTQQATGAKFFANDKATRITTVEVSGSATTGYQVRCILKYHDDGKSITAVETALKDYYIEYVPFVFDYPVDATTGVATLPNIYLMYNVCVYNGEFAESDYIAIDTKGLDADTEVNLFIVETAETYSDNIVKANDGLGILPSNSELYNNNVQTDRQRGDVRVHIAAAKGSKLKNVHVYHNFDVGSASDADYADTVKNKKNATILYNSYHNSANVLFDSNFSSIDYVPLMVYGASGDKVVDESVAAFDSLDSAKQESRGLYEVKVWIVKGDDLDAVDTSTQPIMTATKGGDES